MPAAKSMTGVGTNALLPSSSFPATAHDFGELAHGLTGPSVGHPGIKAVEKTAKRGRGVSLVAPVNRVPPTAALNSRILPSSARPGRRMR